MARSDWESALRHLSLFDDKWDEAVDLIRARDLYAPALVIYRGSAKYKVSEKQRPSLKYP